MSDMADILDGTLDDLADIPEFKPYPNDAHKVTITMERRQEGEGKDTKDSVFVKMTAIETVELVTPKASPEDEKGDLPLEAGAVATVMYNLKNEFGQGQFKELMKAYAGIHGNKPLKDLMVDAQNSTAVVVTKQRQNKDKTQTFTQIENIVLV